VAGSKKPQRDFATMAVYRRALEDIASGKPRPRNIAQQALDNGVGLRSWFPE
jgi:hypothetical protein